MVLTMKVLPKKNGVNVRSSKEAACLLRPLQCTMTLPKGFKLKKPNMVLLLYHSHYYIHWTYIIHHIHAPCTIAVPCTSSTGDPTVFLPMIIAYSIILSY
jgi:hypothetical protein